MNQPPGYPPPPPPGGGYPPPPPGGGYPAPQYPPGYGDPYAAAKALEQWVTSQGHVSSATPDPQWYRAWWPFSYAFNVARLGRELRVTAGENTLCIVEAFEADEVKRLAGEDRHIYAFCTCNALKYRVSIRSRAGGGMVNEVSQTLGSLFGPSAPVGGILGDPTFEQRYEITGPSRDEAHRGLPMPLRHLLVQAGWRGILELRPQGALIISYDRRSFDPPTLDAVIQIANQVLALAAAA